MRSGTSGSTASTAAFTAGSTWYGSPLVRTTSSPTGRALRHRHVGLGERLGLEAALVDVADHADDGAVLVDVTVRPIGFSPGKYFLAADSLMITTSGASCAVGRFEEAAAAERNPQRLVIVRRHAPDADALARRRSSCPGTVMLVVLMLPPSGMPPEIIDAWTTPGAG